MFLQIKKHVLVENELPELSKKSKQYQQNG